MEKNKASESLLTLLDNANNIIHVVARDTHEILYVNKAGNKYADNRNVTGELCYKYIFGLESPCPWCQMTTMQDGKAHIDACYVLSLQKWQRVDYIEMDWSGRPAVAVYNIDITAEKKAEQSLRQNHALYAAATEAAQLSVWEYDIASKSLHFLRNLATDNFRKTFHIDEYVSDIPALLARILSKEDFERSSQVYEAIDKGVPSINYEYWTKELPGIEPICLKIIYTTVFDEDDNPVKAYGTGQDITIQRREEEKYNNIFQQMASAYPSSLGTFRLNLSKNKCVEGQSPYKHILKQDNPSSVDAFFAANAALIANQDWQTYYLKNVSREQLLELYKKGKTEFSIQYPILAHTGDLIWIDGFVKMAQNPSTGDVEAITYALNITGQKETEGIVNKLVEEGYDYIALINIRNKTFTLHKKAGYFAEKTIKEHLDYDTVMHEVADRYVIPEDAPLFLAETKLASLVAAMPGDIRHSFSFYGRGAEGEAGYRKKLVYNWLDSSKTQLVCAQVDITIAYEQERKAMEERAEFAQNAEKLTNLETIVNSFPEGLIVYKKEKDDISILMANQYLCDLVAIPRDVIMNKSFNSQIATNVHPDDLDVAINGMKELFEKNENSFFYRSKYKGTDKYIWLNALGKAVEEPDGSKFAYVVYHDATDQKRREAEMDRKLKEIAVLNPNTIGNFHLNLTKNSIISLDLRIPDVYGMEEAETADEFIEACIQGMHTLGDQERMREIGTRQTMLEAYMEGRTSFSGSYRILETSSHLVLWMTSYYNLVKNTITGDIEVIIATVNTNDAIRGQEIVTRITNEDYEYIATVDLGQKAISYCDAKPIFKVNAPVPGMSYADSVKIITAGFIKDSDKGQNRDVISLEHIVGKLVRYENFIYTFSIKDDRGKIRRKQVKFAWMDNLHDAIIMARTDITASFLQEQRHLEMLENALQVAESANSAKTDFMSRISHDIRTPISIISNMTDFAFEDIDDKEKLHSDLTKIATSNKFLLSLINDVLDISKIDSGKIELKPESYLFQEYILNIRNILEPLCAQKGLEYAIEDQHHAEVLVVDKIRLNQVTINLISNAVKYTPKGGTIRFSVSDSSLENGAAALCIKVVDNGIGMSQEFQKVMFEPFTQEYSASRRNGAQTGSGLGLSIVKRLVELMGGTVRVQSALGKGTTMEIHLTLFKGELTENQVLMLNKTKARPWNDQLKGRVLLVEDNIINTEIAVRILTKFGLSVDKAGNGQEGWQMFEASTPGTYRAILMDIQMPIMSGYDATEKIRAAGHPEAKTIPIIAMTADAFAEALERAKAVGMNDYVTKPLQVQVLYTTLARYLHKVN